MSDKTFEVTCPDCGGILRVDAKLRSVISHTSAPRKRTFEDFETAARAMHDQEERKQSLFRQAVDAEKNKDSLLEKRFAEALKKAKESPSTERPLRPGVNRSRLSGVARGVILKAASQWKSGPSVPERTPHHPTQPAHAGERKHTKMDLPNVTPSKTKNFVAKVVPEDFQWSRNLAAASLVAGAVLLVAGKRRTALAVATAGAGILLLERPESAQELWSKLPSYIRQGQDFLVRAEGVIERLGEQAARFREAASRFQA